MDLRHWILAKRSKTYLRNLKTLFYEALGYELNLDNPKTFNEKINWLKLYYRPDILPLIVDKYEVRKYVTSRGGQQYLNTLFGAYHSKAEFLTDLETFPDQFIIKPNHWSGEVLIIDDKKRIDQDKLNKIFSLINKSFYNHIKLEWAYKGIQPKILVERYLENKEDDILDYKIYCFNGEAKYFWIPQDGFVAGNINAFYDIEWNKRIFVDRSSKSNYNRTGLQKPRNFDEMVSLAEKLSAGFPFLRVDLYNTGDQIFFGELTIYDSSGFGSCQFEEDRHFGELMKLPTRSTENQELFSEEFSFSELILIFIKDLFDFRYLLIRYKLRLMSFKRRHPHLSNLIKIPGA